MIKFIKSKSIDAIISEWDAIAKKRYDQINSNKDLSYKHVLLPAILQLMENCDLCSAIDIGCGVGFTTKQIASKVKSLLAIDLSRNCIKLAQDNCAKYYNVHFKNTSIEEHAIDVDSPCYTVAIANMTLMTALDLHSFIRSVHKVLVPGGKFIATITHPCFWPFYWEYFSADWFDYTKELIIEAPFRITNESTQYYTTHVHRPLEMYFSVFREYHFTVESFLELMPDTRVREKYPTAWSFPRFAAFSCVAQ